MTINEKTVKSERIYEGKVINLRVDMVELPDRKYSKREIVEHGGAVGVVAVTPDGKLLFVKQFRKAVEGDLLEIPAGKIEKDEDPKDCALRELEEETGYTTSKITKMLDFYTSPGFSNEVIHIYLAEELEQGEACPDEDEYIEVISLTLEEMLELIKKGEVKDSKTIVAILYYQNVLLQER
ncbi:NUDIX hydrolase [Alkaliphilus hydrothermalis]|uniref:ADP-ribose pyrophosphatase n=1 Tax=Alkaliphilus hydrothermalis TaxID=1482730 RepID=A0ABS2NM49_9FIRM|nr:NUDIX hydrolase [Alkaliphilus hydrothermalis]MBM7614025.1 ADP-ribose pyrophosphatase [Alkaliphilus hydrothermalis]